MKTTCNLSLITATDFLVRLVDNNGKANQGRVEVLYNGSWGTVCDDQFDHNAAAVVCSKLGYERSLKFCRKIKKIKIMIKNFLN